MTKSNPIKKRAVLAISTILITLIIDQIIKIVVKTNMFLHESIGVTDWFKICFVENRGMAFGMDFIGTTFLSIFRIVAILFFCFILVKIVRKRYPMGLIFCFSLVVAGAVGNIIDNCLYGLIFEQSFPEHWAMNPASFVPFGEGYGSFLSGKVVDMFYFPLFEWPESFPIVGGDVFFSAIFNFADAAISCGAVALLLFYYPFLSHFDKKGTSKKAIKGEDSATEHK